MKYRFKVEKGNFYETNRLENLYNPEFLVVTELLYWSSQITLISFKSYLSLISFLLWTLFEKIMTIHN